MVLMCALKSSMQCVQVSDLQGHVQELQEALDKEVAAHKGLPKYFGGGVPSQE